MKNLSKCQEMMTKQQEIYQIICITKNKINPLVQIYQDKQIQPLTKQCVQQCFCFCKTAKNYSQLFFSFINCNRTININNGTLRNEANDSKFVTRKQNIVNDNSNSNYGVRNEIIYNTEVLKSNLCDYNNAYILVKDYITATAAPTTQVAFKNCAPFTKFIIKIDGTTINDAEDLDLVMPKYNLIEYSSNYP